MLGDRAQLIKTAMMLELSKEGKTLADLERALSSSTINKAAGVSLVDFGKLTELGKGILGALSSSSVAVGGLAGAGAYAGYLGNEDSNNLQLKKLREAQQYNQATNTLREDMQNPIVL